MIDSLLVVVNSATMIATVTLIYALLLRHVTSTVLRHVVLGCLFGIGAVISMLQPAQITAGVQIDGRNLFLGLAGAFSGPLGTLLALTLAASTRIALGGIGVISAMTSMAFCAAAGLIWAIMEEKSIIKGRGKWLILGGMLSASIPLLLLVKYPHGWNAFTQGGPFMLLAYMGATLAFGFLMHSEKYVEESRQNLRIEAETDPLTGALNRRGLEKRFSQHRVLQNEGDHQARGILVMMIDLDRFKSLNDRYGHDAGDLALRKLVEVMNSNVRPDDLVARLGGDEFVICALDIDKEKAEWLARKFHEDFKIHLALPATNVIVNLSVSMGAVHTSKQEPPLNLLLQEADQLMMAAKRNGRNRYVFATGIAA